jgi:DNA-directed RNA polymerase specialized sigma24 family protein
VNPIGSSESITGSLIVNEKGKIKMKPTQEKRPVDALDLIENNMPADPRENYRYGDLYSQRDHSIVKQAVREVLTDDEQGVIIYSFWNNYPIMKIARLMSFNELEVRRLYSSALQKIRQYCLNDGSFNCRIESIIDQAA